MKALTRGILVAIFVSTGLAAPWAASAETMMDQGLQSKGKRATDKGLRYLRDAQDEDGSWMKSVGITALVLRAFL